MKTTLTVVITLLVAGTVGAVLVYSGGLHNFAGDEPHPAVVEHLIVDARERFIGRRSADLPVPDLGNPQLLERGGAHYVAMCAGCHLGPGVEDTEIRRGLYPQPPNLAEPAPHSAPAREPDDPQAALRRQFWIIKHGIKLTAMPAWGVTHSDAEIWGLVAFLQKLPGMSPEEYAKLQESAADGHSHGRGDAHDSQRRDE